MLYYRERQYSWIMIGLILPVLVVFIVFTVPEMLTRPIEIITHVTFPIIIALALAFSVMTTYVYDNRIVLKFGFGIYRKTFYYKDLFEGARKRIPLWYGTGIRLSPNGMLYRVKFTDVIVFKRRDKNKKISIGTTRPEVFMEHINKAIANYHSTSTAI